MGPPVVQGAPAVPKMGVRARVSDWPQRREVWDAQPPPRYDNLVQNFLKGPQQIRSETRYPFWDLLSHSPSRRMKRSNSEGTISDIEDLDPAAINPHTQASLRRQYGSTSTLDQPGQSGLPPLPEPPYLNALPSASLQTAAQIARGEMVYVAGHRPQQTEASLFSRLRSPRGFRDQQQEVRFSFSHYDVQSIFFNISESSDPQPNLRHRKTTSTVAWAGSSRQEAADPAVDVTANMFRSDENGGLVLSCPFFINETRGEPDKKLGLTRANSTPGTQSVFSRTCSNAGLSVLEVCSENVFPQNLVKNYDIEHFDLGAKYYLKYFYNKDHQNYFAVDENFGPVALSVRREKLEHEKDERQYNYRVILRTRQLCTLRGSILEDSVPSSSKHGTARGLPLKDVLEFVLPELNIHSLRLATSSPRVPELLLQLDQQELSFQHTVGVCFRASQNSQENNNKSSAALEQFLDLLGHKVQLKGFTKYRAQLDSIGDSTGGHSVYTKFREFEVMFHVSKQLPNTVNDTQQLMHKHHIGNDIVTVIFQEPDAPPFCPQNINSHVFIIVRVHRPCSQHTCYSVAVSRCRDVPCFGPLIPAGQSFSASPAFRDFLLMKIINAKHAVGRSEKVVAMAMCSRQEHLMALVENFVTSTPVDMSSSARFSFISLGGKKKERSTPRRYAHLQSSGALTWSVTARDFSHSTAVTCLLAISNEFVVLIEEASRQVVFSCYCRDVIGWSAGHGLIKLFYEHADCVMFSTTWKDIGEITQRLQLMSGGAPAVPMSLRRNCLGQLGFHVNFEGVVADVEAHSFAWQVGLRPGCRLMEICSIAVVTLSHEQMVELLRTSPMVTMVVIPPNRDGTPRRSFSEIYPVPIIKYKLEADLTSCSFREALPTWNQVCAATPMSKTSSNQYTASGPENHFNQFKPSSSFDTTEESSSPSKQSTSSDPEHSRGQSAGLPNGSSSDGGTQYRLGRTRSTETTWLHHHHHHHHYRPRHHHVTKVLRESQLSTTVESDDQQHKFEDKNSSSNMLSSNTLSSNSWSSSSGFRHSEQQGLTYIDGASTDSGIDSFPSIPLALPPVSTATLVLRDIQGEGPDRGLTQKINPTADSNLGHLTENCSLSRLQLWLTTDLPFSCHPVREVFVRMMQSDVTAGEKSLRQSISRVSGILPPSPWRSLTRTASDDSLYRRTLALTSSCGSPRVSQQAAMKWSMLSSLSLPDVHQETETSALQDSDITATSLSGKVFQLEEILRQLQLDLLKEQQDKAALQQQVLNLHQDNLRLQEESQSATDQIMKFTAWIQNRSTLP
ncbi:signal-induced proliferation-associated 1-like protein 2 isoform X2 [Dicentrarchus labrax]|uniref:signal-induced proliferation-associated 1-like protein 2 isoform X2 n=1 Tax=Dicentrarchus labrax TaxID=13489 RepID=UPI0021F56EAC|nr:signal-induced proliferation-associated 1-like protein 2 isoform X2 [Dicentrarchus labrax]